jgi:transposase InsO family protein
VNDLLAVRGSRSKNRLEEQQPQLRLRLSRIVSLMRPDARASGWRVGCGCAVLGLTLSREHRSVHAEHGSTGEITFGGLRAASASSSLRAVRNSATARVWRSGADQSISPGALP